ncbi:MAG: signal peptidase I [Candidatus Pseudobacter hemicellulosilyticus]|uniref:Signal peptidase I n=1 Tax=Candidatus Pseudobacter hemicellulosilyticus TaxID=3121375 RepID=A0AAJ5WSE1_9BACT|nr:MAG: signal peptidase I [Pseudobacter sp.]
MTRKKALKTSVYCLISLCTLYFIAKYTGLLAMYSIPTSSSLPAFGPGDRIWASNLVTPKRFDHLLFRYHDSVLGRTDTYIFRLCGLPGDEVEIRNGDLYVNKQNVDKRLELNLYYLVKTDNPLLLQESFEFDEYSGPIKRDSGILAPLPNNQLSVLDKHHIPYQRYIVNQKGEADPGIQAVYNQPWNVDHFGPVQVPEGQYFVLGNNRYAAQDSRYIGFVKEDDVVGVMVAKW